MNTKNPDATDVPDGVIPHNIVHWPAELAPTVRSASQRLAAARRAMKARHAEELQQVKLRHAIELRGLENGRHGGD